MKSYGFYTHACEKSFLLYTHILKIEYFMSNTYLVKQKSVFEISKHMLLTDKAFHKHLLFSVKIFCSCFNYFYDFLIKEVF